MKTSVTIDKAELSQAVTSFVAAKLGKSIRADIHFTITEELDRFDRKTGSSSITATATYEEINPSQEPREREL